MRDGAHPTSGSGAAVTLYSVRSGTLEHVIDAHSIIAPSLCHWLSCLAISPDAERVRYALDGVLLMAEVGTRRSLPGSGALDALSLSLSL